jgi:hypothetical protein
MAAILLLPFENRTQKCPKMTIRIPDSPVFGGSLYSNISEIEITLYFKYILHFFEAGVWTLFWIIFLT